MTSPQELLKEHNPFLSHTESNPWNILHPHISTIHKNHFNTIIKKLEIFRENPSNPQALLIQGSSGTGKTHLLGQIFKYCFAKENTSLCANIRIPILDTTAPMQHLLREIIINLNKNVSLGYSQFHLIISRIIITYLTEELGRTKKITTVENDYSTFFTLQKGSGTIADQLAASLTKWFVPKHLELDKDLVSTLFLCCNYDPKVAAIGKKWLMGDKLMPDEIHTLGFDYLCNNEEIALQKLTALAHILTTYHLPLILSFDISSTNPGDEDEKALSHVLDTVIYDCPGLFPLISSEPEYWKDITTHLTPKSREIIEKNTLHLENCSKEESKTLIETYLHFGLPYESHPKESEDATNWFMTQIKGIELANLSPQNVISHANQILSESIHLSEKGNKPIPDDDERGINYATLASTSYDREEWEYVIEHYETLSDQYKTAEIFFKIGDAYFKLKKYTKAEVAYSECLALDPSYPYANERFGICLVHKREYDYAINYFKKSIEVGSDDERALSYLDLAHIYYDLGELEKALENYENAIEINEQYKAAEFYSKIGSAFLRLEDYAKAQTAYQECLAINPSYPNANLWLGMCLSDMGEYDSATTHFEKSLEVGSESEIALSCAGLGNIYYDCEHWEKAIEYYENAMRRDCLYKTSKIFFRIGNAYGKMQNYAKAETALRECLVRNPSYPGANTMLGRCLEFQEKYDEAIFWHQKGIEFATDEESRAFGYEFLGNLYYEMKKWECAIENYEHAGRLSNKQKNAKNFFNIGISYHNLKNEGKAETAFRESLALNPSSINTIINLGTSLLRQKKYDEAILYYTNGIELSTDDEKRGLLYANLGYIFYKKEEWKCAIENYENAIQLSNQQNNVKNLIQIASAYEELEDYAKAEATYRKCLTLDSSYPDAYIKLGLCFESQEKDDEAILCYTNGIECSRNDKERALCSKLLGDLYFDLGEWKCAIENYENAQILDDQYKTDEMFFNIGYAYGQSGDYAKAKIIFDEYLALNAAYLDINTCIGACFHLLGEDEDSLSGFKDNKHYTEDLPTDRYGKAASAYAERGTICWNKEEWEGVIENYGDAIRISDQYKTAEIFFRIGSAYAHSKDYVKAEIAFRECFALDSSYQYVNASLGTCLYLLGKYDEAINCFENECEFYADGSEENAFLCECIGDVYYNSEKWEKAIENYEAAIRQHKTAEIFFKIGSAYEQLEDYAKAEVAYRECLALNPSHSDVNAHLVVCLEAQET